MKNIPIDLTPSNIEDYWAQGIHVSSNGTEMNISDMPLRYLQNVINKFGNECFDVSGLQKDYDEMSDPNSQQVADSNVSPDAPIASATQ